MKCVTPEISWHGRDPIYSVDFQYLKGDISRLATCGTDQHVRLWEVKLDTDGRAKVEFLSTLSRHTRTVNVVRFSPDGQTLASAGDDSVIMLWKLNEMPPGGVNIFEDEDGENKENWSVYKNLRSHLEDIADINWSSCGKYMISGSIDNSAILWDVKKGCRLGLFPDHKSFVQGVAFDPLQKYLATLSSDRCCRIFSFESKNCVHTVNRVTLPNNNNVEDKPKTFKMFHDDSLKSFFRRLSFSPDGTLLVVPAGCLETPAGESTANTTYVFTRANLSKPVIHLPGPTKPSIVVKFSPVLYELRKVPRRTNAQEMCHETTKSSAIRKDSSEKSDNCDIEMKEDKENKDTDNKEAENTNKVEKMENKEGKIENKENAKEKEDWEKYETMFRLNYRMVYAIATEDSVLLYDTQQPIPFGFITDIHYHTISDLSWSHDGKILTVSSTDGYVTFITFTDNELGVQYKKQVVHVKTLDEVKQRELERKLNKDKKKKIKKKSEVTNGEKSETKKTEENMEVETSSESNKCASSSTLDNESKQPQDSSNKSTAEDSSKPRRVELSTVKSDSTNSEENSKPRRVALISSTSSDENSKPRRVELSSSDANSCSPSTSEQKKPRRVQPITLLSSPSATKSDSKDSINSPNTTPNRPPKRVQLTTLSTPKSEKNSACDTPKSGVDNSSTPKTGNQSCSTPKTGFSTPKSGVTESPVSSTQEKKTPRRVGITTLESFSSPSTSKDGLSPSSNKEGTPRRVALITVPLQKQEPTKEAESKEAPPCEESLLLQLEVTQDTCAANTKTDSEKTDSENSQKKPRRIAFTTIASE